ncbi:MAG: PQQ-binding-like beta-propeller repeat protein [Draconibacterium sp.]
MKKLLTIIAMILLVSHFSETFSQTVFQWRGPNRDGKYNETGLLNQWLENGPQLLWSIETLGDGYASPVVTTDKLFINGMENGTSFLFCFDLKGKLLWKSANGKEFTGDGYSANFPGARPSPTVVGDKVYTSSGLGRMACFDAATGKEIWKLDMLSNFDGFLNQFGYAESFVTDEKLLFCFPGGKTNNIVALDRLSGKTVWTSKALGDTTHFCSPILVSHNAKKMLISISRHYVFGVDAQNGTLLWKYKSLYKYDGDHVNTPVYEAPYLYWVSGDENSCGAVKLEIAPDGKSVKEIWSNPQIRNSMGGLIVLDGKLYTTTENKNLNVLDLGNGAVTEKIKSPYGQIIFTDNKFIVYGNNGDVSLFNLTGGKLTTGGAFKITQGNKEHFAHPVIANGILYIRHGAALMAYKIK